MKEQAPHFDEATKLYVFKAPQDIPLIHRQYGLWIFHLGVNHFRAAGQFSKKGFAFFEFFYMSHVFRGSGQLWMPPGRKQQVKAGQCIIIQPNVIYKYGGVESDFWEDFIGFSGPIADRLQECNIIRTGVFQFGTARRLLPIIELASEPARDAQIEANLALQRLLFEVYRENRKEHGKHSSTMQVLLDELKENIHHPWTVSEMAEFCQLTENQLRRLFHKEAGMHPKQYLDRLKMRRAATLLTDTQLSIAEIAARLGYNDQFHFSRRFKAMYNVSPVHYRKSFGKTPESPES